MAVKEFRGCKNLVFAEVTNDDNLVDGGYVTGSVKVLAPVAEISKTVETSSESHYYDNRAAIVINSEGADTVTFTIAIPDDAILAEITGRTFDSTKKMFVESQRVQKYFAVGYILGEKGDGEDERFVWRYKGTFNIPDETSATEDNGTGANNMSLEFTGIYTDHVFENGKGANVPGVAKAAFVRESAGVATAAQWFAQVSTPDTTFTPPTPQTVEFSIFVQEGGWSEWVKFKLPADTVWSDILPASATGGYSDIVSMIVKNSKVYVHYIYGDEEQLESDYELYVSDEIEGETEYVNSDDVFDPEKVYSIAMLD